MSTAASRSDSLSPEQLAALETDIRHIEAGPGAGKTKTLVARFRQQAAARDAGIALLSFTNAAVDVARSRCLDQPQLLESPNFIGTFDGFFHRYVVTPAVLRTTQRAPRYVSSWDDLPDGLRTVSGIRLSCWSRGADGSVQLDENRLNHREKGFWYSKNVKDAARNGIRVAGANRVLGLYRGRTYDAAEARVLAIRALKSSDLGILNRLARRFQEVIVDEFQDCDDHERELLGLLHAARIRVVTVADPDQAIYEFRQLGDDGYRQYLAQIDAKAVATLSTCYRSTPAICALVTSARQVSTAPVVSHVEASVSCSPIQVIVGDGPAAGAAAVRLLGTHAVNSRDARFIAHKKADARRLAHLASDPIKGEGAIPKILAAIAEIRSGADPRTRHSAIHRIEGVLLSLFAWDKTSPPTTRHEQVEALAITTDQLRILASKIISAAPDWQSREACAVSVRAIVQDVATSAALPLVDNVGRRLAKPKTACWDAWAARNEEVLVPEVEAVTWTHVHAVKGAEFEAVIYALPTRATDAGHVLDDWETGVNSEARRVLYVGVSRARKLVALVVPAGPRATQLQTILTRDSVPHEVTVTS